MFNNLQQPFSYSYIDQEMPSDFIIKTCMAIVAEWDEDGASHHKLSSPDAFYAGIFSQYLHRSVKREQNQSLPGDAHRLQALVRALTHAIKMTDYIHIY